MTFLFLPILLLSFLLVLGIIFETNFAKKLLNQSKPFTKFKRSLWLFTFVALTFISVYMMLEQLLELP